MDTPFTLVLPVEYINKPPEWPSSETLSIDVTLRHNIGHLKHSIWLFSDGEVKPIYLRFRKDNTIVSDSNSLSELLEIRDPSDVSTNHSLSLTIDCTLYGNPNIPNRDAIADFFDVDINPQFEKPSSGSKCFTRETLHTTVLSLKAIAQSKFDLPHERLELLYNGEICQDDTDLRHVLKLAVPPLHPIQFSLRKKEPTYPVHLEAVDKRVSFVVYVKEDATAKDLKEAVVANAHVRISSIELFIGAHSFCRVSSSGQFNHLREVVNFKEVNADSPIEVLFDSLDFHQATGAHHAKEECQAEEGEAAEEIQAEVPEGWQPTGKIYAEVVKDGRIKLVDARDVPPPSYELSVGERKFQYSSDDMVLNPAGRVYMSPRAMQELSQVVQIDPIVTRTASQTTSLSSVDGQGTDTEQAQSTRGFDARDVHDGPDINGSGYTQADQYSETDNEAFGHANVQGHAGRFGVVLGNLTNIISENRAVIVQNVVQIGFTAAWSAYEQLFLRPQLKLYVALTWFLGWIGVMWFGRFFGELIDEHLLVNAHGGTLDYAIAHLISLSLKATYDTHDFVTTTISHFYMRAMNLLHPPRYEVVREQIVEGGVVSILKRRTFQVASCVLMAIGSFFPFLENALIEWARLAEAHEDKQIKKSIQTRAARLSTARLAGVQALVQRSFSLAVDDIMDSEATFSDLLTSYLVVCWVERHGLEKPFPRQISEKLERRRGEA